MKKLVNLTPHQINEVTTRTAFPPSGTIARVSVQYTEAGKVNGIPLYKAVYGLVTGLPAPEDDTIYIVSGLVLEALQGSGRSDCVAPGELVRDEAGKPIGCRGFKK